jgi:hypothetical protein
MFWKGKKEGIAGADSPSKSDLFADEFHPRSALQADPRIRVGLEEQTRKGAEIADCRARE